MKIRRTKVQGREAVYHCMTRVVNGEKLFKDRDKEMLRKMIWQLADFSGVQVLTYCVMSNHFHVLLRVPDRQQVDDKELMRRYQVLYPKPTQYQSASAKVLTAKLTAGDDEADLIRQKLLARMGDVSEYMKAVKQRFSVWYNRNHNRYGTLWADRFKSVLVEGAGNPLQTMAAYIDLNPVRAGLVEDPKDYRFCGYAEAVASNSEHSTLSADSPVMDARAGLQYVWRGFIGQHATSQAAIQGALKAHRRLIFGKGASPWTYKGKVIDHAQALKVLEAEQGELSKAVMLRCRVRYFMDGAILGSAEFVRGYTGAWQRERLRKHRPKVNAMIGGDWGGLAVIQGLRKQVFS